MAGVYPQVRATQSGIPRHTCQAGAMAGWKVLEAEASELAAKGRARLESTGLSLVGTLRRDGSPRITPVEPLLVDGELYLGMMWQSQKAKDLLRDPRCVVHSTVLDKSGSEGDFKAYGNALPVDEATERDAYCAAMRALTGWAPEGERWHLFRLDIQQVAWFQAVPPEGHDILVWRPGGPAEKRDLPQ
ncbi:MAG: pyridoxamine 5'-phosphate oxidase family protein [Acidimicrobiales bacterium]